MKHFDQQPGLFALRNGWKFYEGALVRAPKDRHEACHGLYGKTNMTWGPTSMEYDDSAWLPVDVPHDSLVHHDFTDESDIGVFHGGKVRGPVWYRLHFLLDEADRDKQILLEFEGVSREATVYVNGVCLYVSRSGYHPFTVDLTDVARFGQENVLVVEIDPSEEEGWWYEGCGIYRSVWLIKKEKVHIAEQGLFVRPELEDGQWIVRTSVEVENTTYHPERVEVRVYQYDPEGNEIADAARKLEVEAGETGIVTTLAYPEDVQLWDTDHPTLYRCTAELRAEGQILDYRKEWFGFRTLRFDAETGFYLNGVAQKIKGFCIHQDHTGVGVAVPYAIKEYRLRCLKEIGATAIRTAHHTDPEIQEIADHIGLMVMEESRSFRTDPDTLKNIRDMARRARNHPSVIFYSLFNEEPLQGNEYGVRIARRMRQVISREDDSRPFTGANNSGFLEPEGTAPLMDVIGVNYNTVQYDAVHEAFPEIPIVGSETVSAFAVRGTYETNEERHLCADLDEARAPWGNTVRDGWKQVNERPYIAGTFVWTGLDYRGEPTPYRWPTIASLFGALDSCGFKKNAAYLYKAFWTKEPFVHALPDLDQPIDTGTPTEFRIYTNCKEAELFLNGRSLGRKAVDPYEMASWTAPYELGTLRAVGYDGDTMLCDEIQRTPGAVARIRLTLHKTILAADGSDAIAVTAEAIDAMGNFVPSADTLVFFETEGGARVIGTGNGDPNSHEPDGLHYRRLFHGRCQAILQNTDGADALVRMYAEGLEGDEEFIQTYEVERIPQIPLA